MNITSEHQKLRRCHLDYWGGTRSSSPDPFCVRFKLKRHSELIKSKNFVNHRINLGENILQDQVIGSKKCQLRYFGWFLADFFLQYIGIRRLDFLVIALFSLHNFESISLVKFNSSIVWCLDEKWIKFIHFYN